MKKYLSKVLTVIMILAFIFSTMPSNAFALLDPSTTQSQSNTSYGNATTTMAAPVIDNSQATTPPTIVAEDVSKRTKFSKEFMLSDTSREMVLYPQPVHYMKDGIWQEIDDTLITGTDSDGNDVLENTADNVNIQLPAIFAPGKPVTMAKDGYTLQFKLDGNYSGAASAIQPDSDNITGMTDNEKKITPAKLNSAVSYSNVMPNIDIKYDVEPEQLKEAVIVKSLPASPLTYTYDIIADQLTPVLQKDNSINFYPAGKTDGDPIFVMPAPSMIDAGGVISYDVSLTLNNNNGKYSITFSPSMDWMKDSKRAWPIAIDPQVIADLSIDNIRDQQVDSNNNNVNYQSYEIEAGHNSSYGIERIYLMYAHLPALTSADLIIDSTIQIYRPFNSSVTSQMEVHKVNTTWDDTNLQWSNKPGFDSSIDDYQMVKDSGWYTWDVTDIARGWYAGSNTGMMFKLPNSVENETGSDNKTFYSSDNGTGYRPILTIIFRNSCGLENYWNYHSQDIGRAGTGYVNDYTGNLVMVHNDIGIDGNIMPVSIQHVYNADDKDANTFGCGYGWRTNYNQRVYSVTLSGTTYYVWEDEDGTLHYFDYSSSNTYKDEDGLYMTLKDNETGNYKYSITDKLGNKKYFDSYGRLSRIQNNQATISHIDITYTTSSGPYINTITDGAGRVYQFAYNNNYVIRIDYKGTGSTVLQHINFGINASGELYNVTYNDSKTTSYGYTTAAVNHLLVKATDIDGYYVKYDYYNPNIVYQPTDIPMNKISKVSIFDKTVPGDTLTFDYNHNQTTFTDNRSRVTIEQFNNLGNTTNVQDDQGNAQYASYANNGSGSGMANQLISSSKLQNTVTSFLKNSGGEYTDGWSLVTSGSPGGSWSYNTDSTNGRIYIGSHSIKITRSDEAGNYYRLSQAITLTKGKTYTFSAWVKTEGMSGTGTGTYLAIENQDVLGHYNIAKSEIINTNTSSSDPNTDINGWRRVEATLAIPSNAYSSTVTFSMYQGTIGTAYYDCLQAEEAPSASRYNLVDNSDFLYQGGSSTTADYWTGTNLSSSDIRTTASSSGCPRLDKNCFTVYGDANTSKNINQNVVISGNPGDVFTVSGWAQGDAAILSGSRIFALIMQLYHSDGTYDSVRVSFNPDVNTWQYGSGRLVATKSYTHFQIYACYYGEVNSVSFDGIQIYREEFGTSYTYNYDANGNITNSTALASTDELANDGYTKTRKDATEYTNNNATTETSTITHNQTTTTLSSTTNGYDPCHNQTSSTTGTEESTTTYDSNGNVTAEKQVDPANPTGTSIENNTTYTTDHNYTATTTDESRHTTTYNNDLQLGTLQWIQQPNDTSTTRTSFSYNSMNQTTVVSKPVSGLYNGIASMQNSYTYADNDNIGTISHNNTTSGNDTTYTLNYGDMRKLTSVQVGSGTPRTLVTNTYDAAHSYDLTRATYGNSQWVNYTYDNSDRITGIQFDNDSTSRFSIMYNNAGNVGSLTDNSNNLFTKYIYDMADRLQSVFETGINGRTYSHSYTSGYDDSGNFTSFLENLNGSSWTTNYTYDGNNRLQQVLFNYGSRSSYTLLNYDAYGRVTARNVSDNGTQIFDTIIDPTNNGFVNPDSTHTSNLVHIIENKKHSGGGYDKTLTYGYDANSNITSISDGTNATTYAYDGANQLVRENNQAAGKTWTWVYDAGGNIREKREYGYTTDADLTGKTYTSVAYGYTDSRGWGDLMTSYNGAAITYDDLGNPTGDGTWTYTWEGGRNLIGLSKTGTTASYTYNMDGIRTSKTVNGVTTNYTLVDDKVTQETDGTNNIYYRYDSNDKLVSMNLNGTEYYYFRNAQDDIMGLFDCNGNMVVEYAYDAWGNILSTTGSLASTVGVLNPYRYRGYRYDTESGLYYLQSRYYSQIWGRFLDVDNITFENADMLSSRNTFSYCYNNPIIGSDPSGMISVHLWYVYPFGIKIWAGFVVYFSHDDITKLASIVGIPVSVASLATMIWQAMVALAKHAKPGEAVSIPGVVIAAITASLTIHTAIMTFVDKGNGVYWLWNWLSGYCGTFPR